MINAMVNINENIQLGRGQTFFLKQCRRGGLHYDDDISDDQGIDGL